MHSAGAAVRRRSSLEESDFSTPASTQAFPIIDKPRSLVSVKSFAPAREHSLPIHDEEDKWGEPSEEPQADGVRFPLITTQGNGEDGEKVVSKAQLMWHTAYNKQRVARAFTNQLVINRGLYGSGEDNETGQMQEVMIKYWTLNPRDHWKRYWDFFQALFLVYVALLVPYRVGFRDPAEGVAYWLETVIDVYFLGDLILNCVTGYLDDEGVPKLVMDFDKIMRNYMKAWFWVDLLAIIPVDVMIRHYEGRLGCSFEIEGCPFSEEEGTGNSSGQLVRLFKLLRLFRLLKLLRLVKVQSIFEKYQDDVFQMLPMLTLGKLLVLLLYLGHIIGCFYMFCSHPDFHTKRETEKITNGLMNTWLMIEFGDETAAEDASRTDRYVASMYWAFTTMTTVGYGDISAVTTAERASAIAGMIIGGFVFSYIIGVIADVIANLDQSSRSHAKKMQSVSQFVRDNELPKKERKSVLHYFRMQSVRAYSDEVLLMEMPYALRKSIVWFKFREIIEKVPFFYGERDFVKVEICSRFQTATYPAQTLVYQRSEASSALFIVAHGEVKVTSGFATSNPLEPAGDTLATLHQGSYFGEELVCGHPLRTATVRCNPPTKFHILDPADLLYLVEIFPTVQKQLIENFSKRQIKLKARRASGSSGSLDPAAGAQGNGGAGGGREPGIAEGDKAELRGDSASVGASVSGPNTPNARYAAGVMASSAWADVDTPDGTPRSPGLLAGAGNAGGAGYRVGPPPHGARTGHAKAVRIYESPAGSFAMPPRIRVSDDASSTAAGTAMFALMTDIAHKLDALTVKVDRLERARGVAGEVPAGGGGGGGALVEQDVRITDHVTSRGTTPRDRDAASTPPPRAAAADTGGGEGGAGGGGGGGGGKGGRPEPRAAGVAGREGAAGPGTAIPSLEEVPSFRFEPPAGGGGGPGAGRGVSGGGAEVLVVNGSGGGGGVGGGDAPRPYTSPALGP